MITMMNYSDNNNNNHDNTENNTLHDSCANNAFHGPGSLAVFADKARLHSLHLHPHVFGTTGKAKKQHSPS